MRYFLSLLKILNSKILGDINRRGEVKIKRRAYLSLYQINILYFSEKRLVHYKEVKKMKKLKFLNFLMFLTLVLFFTGCYPEDCPPPDASKITASRGTTATGGMIIQGTEGAVEPGATVTITDANGKTVTTTADEKGGFTLLEADLPDGFDHSIGNTLSVTQKSEGCKESPAVNVPILP